MKKLNLVMCFFGLLGTLTLSGCSSADKQKVVDYLKENNAEKSENEYLVKTSTSTSLYYRPSEDIFFTNYGTIKNHMQIVVLTKSTFNDTVLNGNITIWYKGDLYLDVDYKVNVSEHKYSSIDSSSMKIDTNKFGSSSSSDIATIMVNYTKGAVDNASSYLSSNGLPYIY